MFGGAVQTEHLVRKQTRQTSKRGRITVPHRPLKIGLLGPPEARVLDLAGPWEVFSRVNEVLAEQQPNRQPGYQLALATIDSSRSINCFGELNIKVAGNFRSLDSNLDTLLIGGGRATWELPKSEELLNWLRQVSARARRVAAIGSGAFFLAEAGLLQAKRVTTHWRWVSRLQRSYPSILVDPHPVFVRDGKFYTSAGVSVSIDLSLAMAEEDYGHEVATEVAKRLVIFVHRPGGQAQVSRALILQGSDHDRFRDLGVWISNHLDNDLTVETLAKRSAMSVRNFARRFRQSFGITPAEFVTRVRVEAAGRRLEESTLTMEQIAAECGFSSAELLRRACHRVLGYSPNRFRNRAPDGRVRSS
jgi:transcriptional regulator GlxA family with amidase domain